MDARSEPGSEAADDPRARRRAQRAASNRDDILDAAERVFADKGLAGGSLRDIAQESGFSTAAIYNYFENKQHLLEQTLLRRGLAMRDAIGAAADRAGEPIDRLHAIVDAAIDVFESYPDFRRLLGHVPSNDPLGSAVVALAMDNADLFTEIIDVIAGVVRQGQRKKQVRAGDPFALTRLYIALTNEHVVIASAPGRAGGALTNDEFHDLVDGALRPTTR